jgi:hypothetical protein
LRNKITTTLKQKAEKDDDAEERNGRTEELRNIIEKPAAGLEWPTRIYYVSVYWC